MLQVLADHGQLAPDRFIVLALSVEFGIKASFSEVREMLSKLEEKKHVVSIRRDDAELLWSVTELGKSILAELR
jgi:hypothetical protein